MHYVIWIFLNLLHFHGMIKTQEENVLEMEIFDTEQFNYNNRRCFCFKGVSKKFEMIYAIQ